MVDSVVGPSSLRVARVVVLEEFSSVYEPARIPLLLMAARSVWDQNMKQDHAEEMYHVQVSK